MIRRGNRRGFTRHSAVAGIAEARTEIETGWETGHEHCPADADKLPETLREIVWLIPARQSPGVAVELATDDADWVNSAWQSPGDATAAADNLPREMDSCFFLNNRRKNPPLEVSAAGIVVNVAETRPGDAANAAVIIGELV